MRKTLVAVVFAVALALTATNAWATILTTSSPQYVGNVVPGEPASLMDEVGYINNLIDVTPGTSKTIDSHVYTRPLGSPTGLPDASSVGATKTDMSEPLSSDQYTNINVTGFTYILAKYDGPNPGAGAYVWYVANLATVDVPGILPGPEKYDISHYSLFKASVPDGGMTLLLLGGALVAVETLRRRFTA
jgi:hypothetical protein